MKSATQTPTDDAIVERKQLRQLLGASLNYKGQQAEIIEVLDDGAQLVLRVASEANDKTKKIQADQFGDARRRLSETINLSVYAPGTQQLLPSIQALLDQQE